MIFFKLAKLFGGQNDMFAPPPIFSLGGGGTTPRIDASAGGGGGGCGRGVSPSQGRQNVFSFGGGGQRQKKGTIMSKRALTVYMRIIITNALMKHHCRRKVSFYMFSVVFFSWGNYKIYKLNISSHKKN